MAMVVVPLAGPDCYLCDGGFRALLDLDGQPRIKSILSSRPWVASYQHDEMQLIFVTRAKPPHSDILASTLQDLFPGSTIVMLGEMTRGAPCSVLAGLAQCNKPDQPVIVDLADVMFSLNIDLSEYFHNASRIAAIAPWFYSRNPAFSYFEMQGEQIIQSREKQVISSNASAGVYIFRDLVSCLKCLGFTFSNPDIGMVGETFFVCPGLNGLIQDNDEVLGIEVRDVVDFSSAYHGGMRDS